MDDMRGREKRPCLIFGARLVTQTLVAEVLAQLGGTPLIIAADAGWQQAVACGLRPHLVVGDFDSAPRPAGPLWCGEEAPLPRVLALPAEKDDTDLHYAAKQALLAEAGPVVLLGVLGGRVDHTQASLATLWFLCEAGATAYIADETAFVYAVRPGETLRLARQENAYLSVFPVCGQAAGVRLCGVKYPLQRAQLTAGYPLGVSNEFAEETAEISCQEGGLLVFVVPKHAG